MKLDVPLPPEMQAVPVYRSPDWAPIDAPIYVNEWPLLLDQARKSLDSRRAAYPGWIQRGQISQEDADRDVQAWEMIVAEWEWALSGEGLPPHTGAHTLAMRRAAVKLSLERIDAELRRGNRTHDIFRQAHLAMALAWHLDRLRDGEPELHFTARLNRQLRAEGRGQLEFLSA